MTEAFDKIIKAIQDGLMSIIDDWPVVIAQLIATAILIIVVRVFLWKPITKYLQKRQEILNNEYSEAKANNEKAKELKEIAYKEYEGTKQMTAELKEKLESEAYQRRDEIIEEARSEAKRRIDQVDREVEQTRQQSLDKIKEEIKTIAFSAAEKIIEKEIDRDVYEDEVKEFIDEELDY